jgi:hypothetical protein
VNSQALDHCHAPVSESVPKSLISSVNSVFFLFISSHYDSVKIAQLDNPVQAMINTNYSNSMYKTQEQVEGQLLSTTLWFLQIGSSLQNIHPHLLLNVLTQNQPPTRRDDVFHNVPRFGL